MILLGTLRVCNRYCNFEPCTKKLSITSTSQSLKGLKKQGFHPPLPLMLRSLKYPLPMPLLSQQKQTKTGRTHKKENPHTTYPSKISHFAYYPLKKRSYYSQDINLPLSLSTTQHHTPISLLGNTIPLFLFHTSL